MALMRLSLCYLYASGMNVYGDRGNVTALAQRCRWRGIDVDVVERGVGEAGPMSQFDLIFAGGGQDRDQVAVSRDLQGDAGKFLREAVEDDVVVLSICGTYQLLGHYFQPGESTSLPGIGVFDAWTIAGPKRFIGDTVIRTDAAGAPLEIVGFENHSGRTFLGPRGQAFGQVVVGAGNNGDDRGEGARYRNAFGSYLHGPLLPKNPALADHLLRLALNRRYGAGVELAQLDDSTENDAHRRVVTRVQRRGRVKSGAI